MVAMLCWHLGVLTTPRMCLSTPPGPLQPGGADLGAPRLDLGLSTVQSSSEQAGWPGTPHMATGK